jgi:CheY-like chemotaxis protein/nitrogen-specific signal transduction histidine kinase
VPEFDGQGAVHTVLAVTQDITQRKHMEQAMHEAARRKDEFLATLAHELRNPLAPLRNGLQLLKLTPVVAQQAGKTVALMERQLAHMVRLADDLMDVSRISRGKLQLKRARITVAAVIEHEHALEACRPTIEAGGQLLMVQLPPDPVWLQADLTRLAQVVGNLLNNASKYTPHQPCKTGQIELNVQVQDDQAVITVADNGLGIAANMLPRVFELFTQVDHTLNRAQGGLGIGLALVKMLVRMHGGSITAYSDGLGKGSTFTVRLPVAPPKLPVAATAKNTNVRTMPTRGVLVVDDNIDSAQSLAELLALQGHTVHTAHNGAQACTQARNMLPEIVFLDLGLPDMSGVEVAHLLRQERSLDATVLVALTGWGSEEDKRRTKAAGFDHHLAKPVQPDHVNTLLVKARRQSVTV